MWILWVGLALVLGTMCAGIGGGILCALMVLLTVFGPFMGFACLLDRMSPYYRSKKHQQEYDALWEEAYRRGDEVKQAEKRWNELIYSLQLIDKNDKDLCLKRGGEISQAYATYYQLDVEYQRWYKEEHLKSLDDLDRKYYGNNYNNIMEKRKNI